jgi:SprB repeat
MQPSQNSLLLKSVLIVFSIFSAINSYAQVDFALNHIESITPDLLPTVGQRIESASSSNSMPSCILDVDVKIDTPLLTTQGKVTVTVSLYNVSPQSVPARTPLDTLRVRYQIPAGFAFDSLAYYEAPPLLITPPGNSSGIYTFFNGTYNINTGIWELLWDIPSNPTKDPYGGLASIVINLRSLNSPNSICHFSQVTQYTVTDPGCTENNGVYCTPVELDEASSLVNGSAWTGGGPIVVSPQITQPDQGVSNGAIFITASGGIPPYFFNWSNGQNSGLITNLAAGLYRYTITDSNLKTKVDSVNLVAKSEYPIAWDGIPANLDILGTDTFSKPYLIPREFILGKNTIASGVAGEVSATIRQSMVGSDDIFYIGLKDKSSAIDPNNNITMFDFLMAVTDPNVQANNIIIYEKGVVKASAAGSGFGTKLQIVRNAGVKYYVNGTLVYTHIPANGTNPNLLHLIPALVLEKCGVDNKVRATLKSSVLLDTLEVRVFKRDWIAENEMGYIRIEPSGGRTPYAYKWSDLASTMNTSERSSLAPGNYFLTVTDGGGKIFTSVIQVLKFYNVVWSAVGSNITYTSDSLYQRGAQVFGLSSITKGRHEIHPDSTSFFKVILRESITASQLSNIFIIGYRQVGNATENGFYGLQISDNEHKSIAGDIYLPVTPVSDYRKRDWANNYSSFEYTLKLANRVVTISKNNKVLHTFTVPLSITMVQPDAIFSNLQAAGLKVDILTTIEPKIPVPIPAYAVPQKRMESELIYPVDGILRVKLDELYNPIANADQAKYSIYDWQRVAVVNNLPLATTAYGSSWFDIPITALGATNDEYYTMEIVANKQQVYKIRFRHSVSSAGENSAVLALSQTFIQGYMDGANMRPVLLNSKTQGATNLGNPLPTQCDSITVSLHNAATPFGLVHTKKVVLNTNGTASITFPESVIGANYYIVIKGRNILETWSKVPVLFTLTTSYHFGSPDQAYGNNLGMVGSIPVIYSGDIDGTQFGDGSVDLIDYSVWEQSYNNFEIGYKRADLSGDGSVDVIDYSVWEQSNVNGVLVSKP